MTENEKRMLAMLKRILRALIIGGDIMPGRFEIADLIEEVENSEDDRCRTRRHTPGD